MLKIMNTTFKKVLTFKQSLSKVLEKWKTFFFKNFLLEKKSFLLLYLIKLKEYEEKLKIINDNFQEIIKKPYVDRIEKGEPLAKLTKDIMDELGIK